MKKENEKERKKEIEEAEKFLKGQGLNLADLEKETKAVSERLKKLDRRIQSSRGPSTYLGSVEEHE